MAIEYKKITRSVLSYCDIPEEITEKCSFLDELSSDTYVEYIILRKEEGVDYSDFVLDNWILEDNPEMEGRTILIHIDY